MAIYKVKDDGKAQSGLKAGDQVVTGGGTYKITGVNADGSYKSEKVNNETTSTYKGSYANSGGSSGGGGGGGTKKNSQYTSPTLGNTWNANTDYQAIINEAIKNGDYVTAAKAEQFRNQKIRATGSKYNTTNTYLGYLPDLGIHGQQQMADGASWQDVLATYNARNQKASTTQGLDKYRGDEVQQMMWNYINDQMKLENQKEAQDLYNGWVEEYEQNNPKDEYQGKYDARIDKILNEILNRDDFSYDAMNDPLYQQYKAMYQREGDRAMKETLAEAAAGAGGMNTYAITAAQQANSYYNSMLNDKIPELYQLAYDMYLNDKESKVQDLGILQNMDATQYNRYRDTINDYYNDKNFAFNAYQSAVQQGNWQNTFDYNSLIDDRNWNNDQYWTDKEWNYNDEWKNKEWNESESDEEYERNLYDQESAKEELWKMIELGVTPSADLIKRAGMSETDVALAVEAVKKQQAEQAAKSKSSGGGSPKVTKDPEEDPANPTDPNKKPVVESKYFKTVSDKCDELVASGDEWGAAACAKEAFDNKYITKDEYNKLLAKCNPLLDITLGKTSPQSVFGI